MDQADSNYSINPWMNRRVRPGDDVDPSPYALNPEEVIEEISDQVPTPLPAGVPMRFLGRVRTQPGIADILGIGPTGGVLMQDTPTKQDSGQPGTMQPSLGAW